MEPQHTHEQDLYPGDTIARQTRESLAALPTDEVLEQAVHFQRSYRNLLEKGHREFGRIDEGYFLNILDESFPDADSDERVKTAQEIYSLLKDRFGLPRQTVPQENVIEGIARARGAREALAARLTAEDILRLEAQARRRLDPEAFEDDNYERFKAQCLADWVVQGLLSL